MEVPLKDLTSTTCSTTIGAGLKISNYAWSATSITKILGLKLDNLHLLEDVFALALEDDDFGATAKQIPQHQQSV